MVIQDCSSSSPPEVKWIGSIDSVHVPSLEHKTVQLYKKCLFGALTLKIGDYILVSNADSADPDTIAGCDVARILHLYELREMSHKDPYRAIVQWYSRPECIPHKEFDSDEICIDFNIEVIEEHRPYDPDISLETVFRKCSVVFGNVSDSASGILENTDFARPSCSMFVCRYKFVKVKQSYKLVPLQCVNESDVSAEKQRTPRRKSICTISALEAECDVGEHAKKSKIKTPGSMKRRQSVMPAGSSVEFIDINDISNENKVSPIKIIGGKSVVRLSSSASSKHEDKRNHTIASPLTEKNMKTLNSTSRTSAARRNLNLSLEDGANTTADSDYLDYSIIKNTPDNMQPNNDMRIKLRVSERRRSTRLVSFDDDPLKIYSFPDDIARQCQRKRVGLAENVTPQTDIYCTPSKKSKDCIAGMTPSGRKSILKSAASKVADGTPKRSIQLSDVVEKRIFQNDEIISTPKRGRHKKIIENELIDSPDSKKNSPRVLKSVNSQIENTVITPSQKMKMIRSGDLTPALTERQASSANGRKTDLQLVRENLHVSVVPKSLPCRENEFNNIYTFLESKIQDGCGGCMYVSGVPGTGKTATVTGVIRMLQRQAAEDHIPDFEFLEINGMRLTEPRQAYVQIYKQLTGKTLSWEHAHSLLEKRFTTPAPRRVTTVLLVDELDILCNRRQDVVYNLLDWPSKSAARLVVVTIANTMDLPERLLMGKVTSRLGLTRLTFQPYTHKQLQEIVSARLGGSEAFKSDAVQLVARKVAAVSGDARRALDICRRATEIADNSQKKSESAVKMCVNMIHVQQALTEMIASAKVQAIKNCSRMEQIFLQAIVAEVTRTGVEETSFQGIYTQMEAIAPFLGAVVPSTGRTLRICSQLGSQRLIICEHSRNDIFQKILLNVSMDDIHYALKVNTT